MKSGAQGRRIYFKVDWKNDPSPDCARKMTKLMTTLFALTVACETGFAQVQAPASAAQAPATQAAAQQKKAASAPAAGGAKSIEARIAACVGCHGIKGYQASFPE